MEIYRCGCGTLLDPDRVPRICAQCQAVRVTPPHREWGGMVKMWLVWGHLRRMRTEGMTGQQFWERLLVEAFRGRGAWKWAVTPDEVWPHAVREARAWQDGGGTLEFK